MFSIFSALVLLLATNSYLCQNILCQIQHGQNASSKNLVELYYIKPHIPIYVTIFSVMVLQLATYSYLCQYILWAGNTTRNIFLSMSEYSLCWYYNSQHIPIYVTIFSVLVLLIATYSYLCQYILCAGITNSNILLSMLVYSLWWYY